MLFVNTPELNAAKQLNNRLLRENVIKIKINVILKIYHMGNSCIRSNNGELSDSAPRSNCINKLTKMGFNRVGFTDNEW